MSTAAKLAAAKAALQVEIAERRLAEQALRDSEERFRSVLENSLDAVYRRNVQTDRYDYMSPVFETITGVSVEEMSGDDIGRVLARIHPDDVAGVEAAIERTFAEARLRGRGTGSLEYRFMGREGRYVWLADNITVLADGEGRPLYRLGIVQDITERKAADAALRQARDELASLLTISQALVSTLNLSALLDLLLQQLRSVIDYDAAAIYLLDGDHLAVTEYFGPMNRHEALSVRVPLEDSKACREVILEKRSVRVDDMLEDDYLVQMLQTGTGPLQLQLMGECRSWLGVPLLAKGQAIGMLRLSHTQPHHFSDGQVRLAAAVANEAAVAIENARLYERIQETAAVEERQRLARELHDSISQVLYGIGLVAHAAMSSVDRNPDKARVSIERVLALVQTGLTEMRAMILELRPELVASEGLVLALEKQANAVHERRDVRVHLDLCEEPNLRSDGKEAIYRIAVEAMNNAAKHAGARRIDVRLVCAADILRLEVSDDGIGFDAGADYPGHLGLRSMRERAAKVGATITVNSAPGSGTCIEVALPL